jgi:hypothetical protein
MARKKKAAQPVVEELPSDSQAESKIGQVSQADAASDASTEKAGKSKLADMFGDFTVFDAFLVISLICVTVATLRVFFAMKQYGGYFWDKPWNP